MTKFHLEESEILPGDEGSGWRFLVFGFEDTTIC